MLIFKIRVVIEDGTGNSIWRQLLVLDNYLVPVKEGSPSITKFQVSLPLSILVPYLSW